MLLYLAESENSGDATEKEDQSKDSSDSQPGQSSDKKTDKKTEEHKKRHKDQINGDIQDLIDKEQEIKKDYPAQPLKKTKQRINDKMWEEALDSLNQ